MSPYADCPIVFASVFLSSFSFFSLFSFPLASNNPPPLPSSRPLRASARSVRMYGAFACRGLFKSSPYCRGSLFFPLQEWVLAWVPRLDKKPADPRDRAHGSVFRIPATWGILPPLVITIRGTRILRPTLRHVGHVDVTFLFEFLFFRRLTRQKWFEKLSCNQWSSIFFTFSFWNSFHELLFSIYRNSRCFFAWEVN